MSSVSEALEPRRDQEEGGGAGLSKLDALSCCRVVPQHCFSDAVFVRLLCTAVERAISEERSCLALAGSPPP